MSAARCGPKWYVLWHPESPGVRIMAKRWWKPRHPFARLSEVIDQHRRNFLAIDLTKPENPPSPSSEVAP